VSNLIRECRLLFVKAVAEIPLTGVHWSLSQCVTSNHQFDQSEEQHGQAFLHHQRRKQSKYIGDESFLTFHNDMCSRFL